MRDQELVNALREHADWWENGDMMDPLGGLEKDLLAAADRIANQSTHVAALQQEIEKLRGQNRQLMLERNKDIPQDVMNRALSELDKAQAAGREWSRRMESN